MRLFIAEKPQLAQAAVSGMSNASCAEKSRAYIKVGDDIVTWCIGHLLESMMPQEINPDMTMRWENLPYQVEPRMKVKEDTAVQFLAIADLIKKADSFVNLGDPDEEGQLLVDEVLEYCGIDPDGHNVQRMLMSDMNPGAAAKALADLRPNADFAGLRNRARARGISDYWFGINLSSALILKAREQNYLDSVSVGRVQTPVLGLVVRRYELNKNFTTAYFYKVIADVEINGKQLPFEVAVPDDAPVDDKGRIIDENYAQELQQQLSGQQAVIISVSHTPKKTAPPLPLSLLRLSSVLDKKYGISPADTLRITQDLREKHRCITYNRSDCQYLTNEQWEATNETLATLTSRDIGLGDVLALTDPALKSRAFNDEKISAHTAICPVPADISKLTDEELKVFREISRFYVAQFLPEMESLLHKATATIGQHTASWSATDRTFDGWKILFDASDSDENDDAGTTDKTDLSGCEKGATFTVSQTRAEKGQTKPLPLFTSGSLMEELPKVARHIKNPVLRAKLQERDKDRTEDGRGIGTPATRSGILETLEVKRNFWTKNKKGQLVPTEAGIKFIASLPDIFTWPDLTAVWEEWLTKIEEGEIPTDKFINGVVKPFVENEVNKLKSGQTKLLLSGAAYTCSVCKTRPLRRFRDNDNPNKYYWRCTGAMEEPQQCKGGFDDLNGKPVARKKKNNH